MKKLIVLVYILLLCLMMLMFSVGCSIKSNNSQNELEYTTETTIEISQY